MHLEPAKSILDRIGYEAAAELTGKHISRIYRWTYPAERGGTGGLIPQRYHRMFLDYARGKGIALEAEDFLPSADKRRRRTREPQRAAS